MTNIRNWPVVRHVAAFFGEVPGAVSGHLNVNELFRVVLVAVFAGGGTFEILNAVWGDLSTILVDSRDAALASAAIAFAVEACRRFSQGSVGKFIPLIVPFRTRDHRDPKKPA